MSILPVLLLAAAAARAEPPAAAVNRVMHRVDELVGRERGRDAREIDALDRQAEALFAELKPLGWRAAAPLGEAAGAPARSAKARLFAVTFLSKLRDPAAFDPLSGVLLDADQDADVRLSAAQALVALDAPPASSRRAFCAALAQPELPRLVEDEVLIALTRLGCDDPAPLLKTARAFGARPSDADLSTVRRALTALGVSRGEAAARGLLSLVSWFPPRRPARAAAIAALARKREDLATWLQSEAFPVVRDALRSETNSPAAMTDLLSVADAFGPRADALLLPLASHPDPEVLAAAAEALARRGDVAALPELEAAAAGALSDPRFAPKPGRPDPAELLSRLEAAVESLRRTRAARK